MKESNIASDFTQGKLKKTDRNKQWRDAGTFLCILLGSLIVAVNMSTFMGQEKLMPRGFSGLAKLIQRAGLAFYDVKTSFTVFSVLFNAVPAVFTYRLVDRKSTILSCISPLMVSVLVNELPVIPTTGDILLIPAFGGIFSGLGIGLILNRNVSGGGTNFIAMSLSVEYKMSAFNYMLLFSAVITLVSGTIFGMDKTLYSTILRFYNVRIISIFYKKYKKRTLLVVTDHPVGVSTDLLELTNHSSAILKGSGSYTAHKRYMVYTMLSDNDVQKMKKRIRG